MSAIVGPFPPFNNPPIQPQFFQPSRFVISNIVLGLTTTVTTTLNNNYVIGQLCRLIIPPQYGCRQLNEQTGFVLLIPSPNQVILDISSQFFDAFISANQPNQPQIVPVGDTNTGSINANGRNHTSTLIPGSFINISPQ